MSTSLMEACCASVSETSQLANAQTCVSPVAERSMCAHSHGTCSEARSCLEEREIQRSVAKVSPEVECRESNTCAEGGFGLFNEN